MELDKKFTFWQKTYNFWTTGQIFKLQKVKHSELWALSIRSRSEYGYVSGSAETSWIFIYICIFKCGSNTLLASKYEIFLLIILVPWLWSQRIFAIHAAIFVKSFFLIKFWELWSTWPILKLENLSTGSKVIQFQTFLANNINFWPKLEFFY